MNVAQFQTNLLNGDFNNKSVNNLKDILIGGGSEHVNYTCISCNKNVDDIELHLKEEHNINKFQVVDDAAENERSAASPPDYISSSSDIKSEFFDEDGDDVVHCDAVDEFDGCLEETNYNVIVKDEKILYPCRRCDSMFENFVDLKDHSILQHNSVVHRRDCRRCVRMFEDHKTLVEHLRLCHAADGHLIKIKKSIENGSFELKTETKKHFDWLSCPDCAKPFRLKSSLALHRKQSHCTKLLLEQDDKTFSCTECPLSFLDVRDLKRHQSDSHHHKLFFCIGCDTTFPSKGSLNLHNIYHHRVHRCSSCNIAFLGRLALTSHVKQHHPGMPIYRANSRFVCEYCSQPFSIRSHLSDHIQSTHLGLINRCEDCGKVLATSETLKVHRLKHRPEMHRTCEHCGRQFYRTGMLTEHIRACHPEALPDDWRRHTTCPYCQSRFTRRESMRRHIEAKHEPKSLSCSFCERQFTCRRYLVRHENKHHLGRPAP